MQMPKLKYFIQCDQVHNDGGKLSALGIFDTIYALIFPASHKRFFLMLGFTGAEGTHKLQVQIAAPDASVLMEANGQIALAHPDQVANATFGIENMPLPGEGRYTVSVFLDGDFCAEYSFRVAAPVQPKDRTPEQIQDLLQREDIVKSANAEVGCERCRSVYKFQHHLDPEASPEPGFMGLPPGEFFVCGACGNRIPVAVMRRNLENIVGVPRQWLGAPPGAQPQPPPGGTPKPQ